MPYHVMIWPRSDEQQKLRELYALNISESDLREWIMIPYEQGLPLTWQGRTLPAGDFGKVTITHTEARQDVPPFEEYEVVKRGKDVTNDWVKGPPGHPVVVEEGEEEAASRNAKRVMVVHGRNLAARSAMFTFLRSIGLEPIEWEEAIAQTGMGSPHNLEAVRAAMSIAQAVVVILTAEDQAGVLPSLAEEGEDLTWKGQPRQNVILEAGLAMGLNPERTILVEIGPIRRATDFEGLNTVRLTNASPARAALRSRLRTAGCDLAAEGTDWMTAESGGDFESCVLAVSDEVAVQQESMLPNHHPSAARLEQDFRIRDFLESYEDGEEAFQLETFVDAMDEDSCDSQWAERTLRRLENEGRVHKVSDFSGTGWYVNPPKKRRFFG
jgi:predicted nucleotide-binding protein